jgi:mono/diheme cytochrome c family protein
MDPAEGRLLFASKGCVVCHSINGVGGEDAPPLDAEFMDLPMNPFEFAARMWRGAETMVELQRDELGDVIYLDGQDLASIIAFVHDAEEQARFSAADIPEEIEAMMGHTEEESADGDTDDDHD